MAEGEAQSLAPLPHPNPIPPPAPATACAPPAKPQPLAAPSPAPHPAPPRPGAASLCPQVLPLGLIFFCASFNLTILQSLKDAIMVTAGGAETLPFLASFCVLPASLAFFVLYGKLVRGAPACCRQGRPAACRAGLPPHPAARASPAPPALPACPPGLRPPTPSGRWRARAPPPAQVAHLPEQAVFYAAIAPLLAFYALFAAVLYPAAPGLHPTALVDTWLPHWPIGLHGLLKVVANWVYSLFFCFAELWGAVVISVLFWCACRAPCACL